MGYKSVCKSFTYTNFQPLHPAIILVSRAKIQEGRKKGLGGCHAYFTRFTEEFKFLLIDKM